ncbi:small multi-drug export protein [Oceanobacillus salinisoli]|uniref:small multi-drug export protein n=1 Tax=Oceanobacillus salinisoli TaxID=2678611 RepID=UPI0012E2E1F3|nr:small multi-drug export protein [Oceanobacillus salinisoli]
MNIFVAYVSVFVLAAIPLFEAYGVIPVATIAGLSVLPVMVLGVVGNIATVLLVIVFINQIKNWRKKRKGNNDEKTSKRSVRAQKLWGKYGLPGLAMLGPLVVGSHLTALMSITFGGTKRKTFYWMTASIITWGFVFTILILLGIDFLGLEERGFINYFDIEQ